MAAEGVALTAEIASIADQTREAFDGLAARTAGELDELVRRFTV